MGTQFDESDFIDREYQESRNQLQSAPPATIPAEESTPIPNQEQLSAKVTETQKKLAELRQAQEQLERERTQLEESRRRQNEFFTGREEMIHHLTRGLERLGDAEQNARRQAEQLANSLADLQKALTKLTQINETEWNQENYRVELSKALAIIENARMEWNSANQKWPDLLRHVESEEESIRLESDADNPLAHLPLNRQNLRYLCKLGLALTWPLALVALLSLLALLVVLAN